MIQGTDEWMQARVGMFTASRIADLMATTKSGPSASRANLIAEIVVKRLTGKAIDGYTNYAMQRGIELEPVARAAYEMHTSILVEEVGFIVHPEYPMFGASPDGLVNNDGLVEFKCPDAMGRHLDALRNGSHATQYAWQVQAQMSATGRAWCDVVSFDPRFPESLQLAIVRVNRDEQKIAAMLQAIITAENEVQAIITELSA